MFGLGKRFVLVLVCVFVVSGVFLVESCVAPVTVPSNPSAAPEIVSIVFHHDPIWCPPTYSTNPYTGEVTETYSGYWRPNGTVDITIKNRPLTSHIDKNGNYVNVYYSFFMQSSHVGAPWDMFTVPQHVVYQSSSDYTIVTFRYDDSFGGSPARLSAHVEGASFDFRVQAVIGYFNQRDEVFEGEGSDWAEFTVVIPKTGKPGTSTVKPSSTSSIGTSSPSDNPNIWLPTFWVFRLFIVAFVCIIVILLVIIMYQRYKLRKVKCVDDVEVGCEVKNNG